eukprot:gene1504-32882_t
MILLLASDSASGFCFWLVLLASLIAHASGYASGLLLLPCVWLLRCSLLLALPSGSFFWLSASGSCFLAPASRLAASGSCFWSCFCFCFWLLLWLLFSFGFSSGSASGYWLLLLLLAPASASASGFCFCLLLLGFFSGFSSLLPAALDSASGLLPVPSLFLRPSFAVRSLACLSAVLRCLGGPFPVRPTALRSHLRGPPEASSTP